MNAVFAWIARYFEPLVLLFILLAIAFGLGYALAVSDVMATLGDYITEHGCPAPGDY